MILRSPSRRVAAALAATALVLALTGCGDDDEGAGDGAATTTAAGTTATSAPETSAPVSTSVVSVYYLRGEKIAATGREVPPGEVATAAMKALLAGPTAEEQELGFVSNIPEGTELLGADISGGVATVNLSDAFDDGGGTMSMMARLAEVVFTLTQFPGADAVSLQMEGEPVTALGGEGIVVDEPIDRSYFTDLRPAILVETPRPFEQVSSPLTVTGENNTFENNVAFQLLTDDGTVLADGSTTGTGDTGTWGVFNGRLEFDAAGAGSGTLRAFEISAADGSETNAVEIPVRF